MASFPASYSDEELLLQYWQGDAHAFHTLVERYAASIYNLVYRLTRERMEAENITQETFLRIILSRRRIRLDEPIKPYVFRIALNLCRDLARKKHPILFADLVRIEPDQDAEEIIVDDAPAPWEKIAQAELHGRLNDAIKRLPAHFQAVIILRYVEELSYAEIAQAIDLPLNTVRTHLRRAKHQLRLTLGAE